MHDRRRCPRRQRGDGAAPVGRPLVVDRRRQLRRLVRRRRSLWRDRGRLACCDQAGSSAARHDRARGRVVRRASGALPARAAAAGLIVAVTVVTVPLADAELGADRLVQAGAFAVEERAPQQGSVELRAVLADSGAAAAIRLGELLPHWSVRTEMIDATPSDTWREHAAPVRIAVDLVLRPAWLAPLDESGVTEVAIEPGATFGLGDHPTTRLCAAALWRM